MIVNKWLNTDEIIIPDIDKTFEICDKDIMNFMSYKEVGFEAKDFSDLVFHRVYWFLRKNKRPNSFKLAILTEPSVIIDMYASEYTFRVSGLIIDGKEKEFKFTDDQRQYLQELL